MPASHRSSCGRPPRILPLGILLGSALILSASQWASAQVTLEVTPPHPTTADQLVRFEATYPGRCFQGFEFDQAGETVRFTAFERFGCPEETPTEPVTLSGDLFALPPAIYELELWVDPCGRPVPGACTRPPRRLAGRPVFVSVQGNIAGVRTKPGEDGTTILEVEVVHKGGILFLPVLRRAGSTIWVSSSVTIPHLPVEESFFETSLGVLEPGKYTVLLVTSQSSILDLPFPFTVAPPETDTLLLQGERFRVRAQWGDELRPAMAVPLTDESGYFWFFGDDNVEVTVKLLDGCGINGHYWTFIAGMTNVEVALLVEDTFTGQQRIYSNASGDPFRPIQDVRSFATCG